MLQHKFLLMSDHSWQMSDQILSYVDMCLNTFFIHYFMLCMHILSLHAYPLSH